MNGVGIYKGSDQGYIGNAVNLAEAPTIKNLLQNAPICAHLQAHGKAVGLPLDGAMGSSKVGHNQCHWRRTGLCAGFQVGRGRAIERQIVSRQKVQKNDEQSRITWTGA
jgi:hypothetical protein